MAHALTLLPTPLVILLQDPAHHQQVEAALTQRNIHVVTYLGPSHLAACETFLTNPRGALVTTGTLFSGMEGASVVVVRKRVRGEMARSDRLRAIEGLVTIASDPIDGASSCGTEVDPRFASCHLAWGATLYRCTTCRPTPILCYHCRIVCHGDCKTEDPILRTHLHTLLPLTSCSCHTTNMCKLTKP